ncbi:hypothetical protein UFOVP273_35 [uncultured Caudovirales phage]|uniref:Uncharacterized protein n=1 Tax=uncultured Caudovirales phage TaxID=2100421 RepID=A0A6J5LJC6_9CAUD|nr:hypothetical protein UFOVP273_35 [uncultured Caudovirales phage]
MRVKLEFIDNESLTVEEVVSQAHANYGKNVKIELAPESSMAYDHIYFGIQQLITHNQLSMLYDRGSSYQSDIRGLRSDVLYKVQEILDQVIIDNEGKVA